MSFFSLRFIIFIAAGLLVYAIAPRRFRWVVLLFASYAFYMIGGPRFVLYLLFTTSVTYIAGRLLGALNAREKTDKRQKTQKKLVAACAILAGFGMLFVLRYLDYMLGLLHAPEQFRFNLIVPLGVSFFTFQSIGYVIDVYRGKYAPERNPLKYALFVSFFPQMIQGPISRFDQLSPQLTAGEQLNPDNLKYGLQLVLWGCFKKLIIADRAGVVVETVFHNSGAYTGSVVAFAAIFYSIQIYCDFSGGIDIARGVAKMFGINLVDNFRRPVFATSLADFWRRWHITLGAWMKDYLFYPLALSKPLLRLGKFTRSKIGGTLGKIIPTSICTFTIFVVIGIWHGAHFRFVAFGLWHASIIALSLLLAGPFTKMKQACRIDDKRGYWVLISIFRTTLIVVIGRFFARAPYFMTALSMIRQTFFDFQLSSFTDGTLFTLGITRFDTWVVFIAFAALVVVEWFQERGVEMRKSLEQRSFFVQWAAILIPLALILTLGIWGEVDTFIYMQF